MEASVHSDEVARLMAQAHPGWTAEAVSQQALRCAATMDERLLPLVREHIDTGATPNFRHEEFSLVQIQRLSHGRSYIDALILMDAYLKDEEAARARILRH